MKDLIERLRQAAEIRAVHRSDGDSDVRLMRQAADALEAFRWVPVSERLPEPEVTVWVWAPEFGVETDEMDDMTGDWYFMPSGKVTHWMPLPEPPQ